MKISPLKIEHVLSINDFISAGCFVVLHSYNNFLVCCGFSEWAVNIQRDSYASYIGHDPLLAYFAVAENESIGRERYAFMQVII